VEVTPSTEVTPMPTPKLDPVVDKPEPSDPSSPTPKSKSSKSNAFHSNDSSIDLTSSTVTLTQASLSTEGRPTSEYASSITADDSTDGASTKSKRSWFKKKAAGSSHSRGPSGSEKAATISSDRSRRSEEYEDDVVSPLERNIREDEWRLSDDVRMQLDI
jgi:hypothetical protein